MIQGDDTCLQLQRRTVLLANVSLLLIGKVGGSKILERYIDPLLLTVNHVGHGPLGLMTLSKLSFRMISVLLIYPIFRFKNTALSGFHGRHGEWKALHLLSASISDMV